MRHGDAEGFSGSLKLSAEVIYELSVRAIQDAGLSEIEQLVFSLRYRLIEEDGPNLMGLEEIAARIQLDSGEAISPDRVMTALERAEAKVDDFIWATLERAIRANLGMEAF